jgi:hypothetical protein
MTTRRGYTILGWLVWQIGSRIVKRKVGQRMAARSGGDRSGDDE